MNKRFFLLFFLVLLLTCLFMTPVRGEEEERMLLRSNYMRYLREEGVYLAQDAVEILYRDYILKGDEAEIHEAQEVLYLRGNVMVYQGEDLLTGEVFIFYYDADHMIMDSPFELLQYREEEQEDGSIEREPLQLTGEYLEMFGEEDQIYSRGEVHLLFRDYRIWSHELDFFQDIDELHLTGNVLIEENGEEIRANQAVLYLEEDIFEAWGDVEADVQIKKSQKNEEVLEEQGEDDPVEEMEERDE